MGGWGYGLQGRTGGRTSCIVGRLGLDLSRFFSLVLVPYSPAAKKTFLVQLGFWDKRMALITGVVVGEQWFSNDSWNTVLQFAGKSIITISHIRDVKETQQSKQKVKHPKFKTPPPPPNNNETIQQKKTTHTKNTPQINYFTY